MTDVNPRDALAEKYFPDLWAKVVNAPGKSKARQKLRKAAEDEQRMEGFRSEGGCCANCQSFDTTKIFGLRMGAHCSLTSDFYGYVEAKPNDICPSWTRKP